MLLLKSAEHQCLNEIATRLPELLLASNISISTTSQNELAEMIKNHVRFNHFPSSADTLVQSIAFPITLMVIAFSPNAVVIDSNCGNAELTSISREKRKLLDKLIVDRIFSKYRDHAREAEILRRNQERANQTRIQQVVPPVAYSRRSTSSSTFVSQPQMNREYSPTQRDIELERQIRELQESIRDLQNPRPCVLM